MSKTSRCLQPARDGPFKFSSLHARAIVQRLRRGARAALENQQSEDSTDYPALLRRTLLNLWLAGQMAARKFVSLAHLITKAGARGVDQPRKHPNPEPKPCSKQRGLSHFFIVSPLITNVGLGIGVFSGRSGMGDFARNLKHGCNSARVIQQILGTKYMKRELIQYVSLPIRAKKGQARHARRAACSSVA